MVRSGKRVQRNSRRQTQGVRSNMRKLHQAVNGLAVQSRLPSDPPPVKIQRIVPMSVQVLLLGGTGGQLTPRPTGDSIVYSIKNDNELYQWALNRTHLYSIVGAAIGDKSVQDDWELALDKVAVWGPIVQQRPCAVVLHVDWFNHDNTATDTGGASSRPRVAFNLPFTNWVRGNNDGNVIGVEMRFNGNSKPVNGEHLGVMQISLRIRRYTGLLQ